MTEIQIKPMIYTREEFAELIKQHLQQELIRKSTSKHSSPALFFCRKRI